MRVAGYSFKILNRKMSSEDGPFARLLPTDNDMNTEQNRRKLWRSEDFGRQERVITMVALTDIVRNYNY